MTMEGADFVLVHARVTFRNVPMHKMCRYRFKDAGAACAGLKEVDGVSECAVVQTTSRVEIYMVVESGADMSATVRRVEEVWADHASLSEWDVDHFDQTVEVYTGGRVCKNLLELAAGLLSVVTGKNEITGQLKDAASAARESGYSGPVLGKLFETVLRVSGRIRQETGMGSNVRSIGDIAVKMADENVGLDAKKKILILGTGERAARVAKALDRRGAKFSVSSMHEERAAGFAELFGGEPAGFEGVLADFGKFDVVFVATTADYFILSHDIIRRQVDGRNVGTIILDISDPRAVSEDVSQSPGVKLMFRDQIEERHAEFRREAEARVPAVEKAVAAEAPVVEAALRMAGRGGEGKDVFTKIDEMREAELRRALEQMGDLDEEKIRIIDGLTKSVVSNIVASPDKD